jgi:hypothetical protein
MAIDGDEQPARSAPCDLSALIAVLTQGEGPRSAGGCPSGSWMIRAGSSPSTGTGREVS